MVGKNNAVKSHRELLREVGYPDDVIDVFLESSRGPTVLTDPKEFLEACLYESHVDNCIVLKDGMRKLGLHDEMPKEVLDTVQKTSTVLEFIDEIGKIPGYEPEKLYSYFYHFPDKLEVPIRKTAKGETSTCLADVLPVAKSVGTQDFYLGELGFKDKHNHQIYEYEKTRTLMSKDVRDSGLDFLGVQKPGDKFPPPCPLWERGNAFLGGKRVGSCVHQDKMLWSNIGKNWVGHKLFLMWPFEISVDVMNNFYEKLIISPLSEEEIATLKTVCRAVIVEPGDVYVFSGGGAHMACGLGDVLNLAAYEAILNYNPANLNQFRMSNTKLHHSDCRSTRDDLDDWNEDVVFNLAESWAAHSVGGVRAEAPSCEKVLSIITAGVKELAQDSDFVYEFERWLRRNQEGDKRRKGDGGSGPGSFEELVSSFLLPQDQESQENALRDQESQDINDSNVKVGDKRKTGFSAPTNSNAAESPLIQV